MDNLVRQKLDGVSYSEIRSRLSGEGYSDQEITSIIRKVDEHVLREEVERGSRTRARTLYRAGLYIAVAGLALIVVSNAGWFLPNVRRWMVYAPFFIGIGIMFYGKWVPADTPGPDMKGPGKIRKKRPFK